jgi:hypothetical protein
MELVGWAIQQGTMMALQILRSGGFQQAFNNWVEHWKKCYAFEGTEWCWTAVVTIRVMAGAGDVLNYQPVSSLLGL